VPVMFKANYLSDQEIHLLAIEAKELRGVE
jgi:hypothetical protein